MPNIHVNTDTLRQLGQMFVRLNDQIQNDLGGQINNLANQLENDWQGVSRSHFDSMYNDWRSQSANIVRSGEDLGNHLQRTAQQLEQADQS